VKKTISILAFWQSASAFSGQLLVSVEEMNASNSAIPTLNAKSVAPKNAPLIELNTPKLTSAIYSPTPIALKFLPTPPSSVKPETFKVLYGTFEVDITKRILNLAKVSETGVYVQEASLPKGKHKLLLVVDDTLGRRGQMSIEFEIQ
jgi:hypothetical protein